MEEFLHHLGSIKPVVNNGINMDKLPTSTGAKFHPSTVPPWLIAFTGILWVRQPKRLGFLSFCCWFHWNRKDVSGPRRGVQMFVHLKNPKPLLDSLVGPKMPENKKNSGWTRQSFLFGMVPLQFKRTVKLQGWNQDANLQNITKSRPFQPHPWLEP